MAIEWGWRHYVLIALGVTVLVAALVGCSVAPVLKGATVPPAATVVGVQQFGCTQRIFPELYFRYYDTDHDPETIELYVIGTVDPEGEMDAPRVFVYFDGPEHTVYTTWLLLPNQPPERMTFEQLQERYPMPCDLLAAITLRKV